MSAKIIALASHKGGSGKTTASMSIAAAIARSHSVLVVDADEMQTAARWSAQADDDKPFPVPVIGLAASGGKIHRELQRFASQYEYIIVDCPPSVTSLVPQSVFLVADLVVVPSRPSIADIWGVTDTLALVDKARVVNAELRVAFLMNSVLPRTQLGRDTLAVLSTLDGHLLQTSLGQRQAYAQGLVLGGTVYDVPGAAEARGEVDRLCAEVLGLLSECQV